MGDQSHEKRVLIIEDEQSTSNVLSLALKKEGLEVEVESQVDGAVEKVANGNYDLVVLDLILPEQDGFEFLKNLRDKEARKKIPVVVVSNLGSEKDIDEVRALGVEDYFIKAHSEISAIAKRIAEKLQNGS